MLQVNASERIRQYADERHRHVARWVMDPVTGHYYETCDLYGGDRCDITAAYLHAAHMAEADA